MLEKQLKQRKLFLSRTIERCNKWLKNAPQGTLRISSKKNRIPVFHHHLESKEDIRLSSVEDSKLIRDLARKDYYLKVIPAAIEELELIDSLVKIKESETLANVYENLRIEKRQLISPVEITKERALNEWLNYEDGSSHEPKSGNYYIPTDNGEMVRSKAEYNIANALLKAGIPYKYEFPFTVKNGTVLHPDFTVRNKSNGQVFFWEHFGLMDDPKYVKNSFLYKLNLYAMDGIFIGNGLIASFAGFGFELGKETIDKMIKEFLT